MAWQLVTIMLNFFTLIRDDDLFLQWIDKKHESCRSYFTAKYYLAEDELDTAEWWIAFFIFLHLLYVVSRLAWNWECIERRVLQWFGDLPTSIVSSFLHCCTSICNAINDTLCWALDTMATLINVHFRSSFPVSETGIVPGSFPRVNIEQDTVVEGGVVQVNATPEEVVVEAVPVEVTNSMGAVDPVVPVDDSNSDVDEALMALRRRHKRRLETRWRPLTPLPAVEKAVEIVKVPTLAIVTPVSIIEVAVQPEVLAEEPAADKVAELCEKIALLEGHNKRLELDVAAATALPGDVEEATSVLKLERDKLEKKIAALEAEHDEKLRQLNQRNVNNDQAYFNLLNKFEIGERQYNQLLEQCNAKEQAIHALQEGYNSQCQQMHAKEQELKLLQERWNWEKAQMNTKEEEWRTLQEQYSKEKEQMNGKEEELKTLQEAYNNEKEQKDAKEQELKALKDERESQKAQTKDQARLTSKIEAQKAQISQLTTQLDGVKYAGSQVSGMLREEQKKVAERDRTITELRDRLPQAKDARPDVKAMEMEMDDTPATTDVMETDTKEKDRLISELKQQLAVAKAGLSDVKDTQMELDTTPTRRNVQDTEMKEDKPATPMSGRSEGSNNIMSSASRASITRRSPLSGGGKIGSSPFPTPTRTPSRTPTKESIQVSDAQMWEKAKDYALVEAKEFYIGQVNDLKKERDKLDNDLRVLRQENKRNSRLTETLEHDSEEQRRKVDELVEQKAQLEQKIEKLENEKSDLETELELWKDGHDVDVEQQNKTVDELEQELDQEKVTAGVLKVELNATMAKQEAEKMMAQYGLGEGRRKRKSKKKKSQQSKAKSEDRSTDATVTEHAMTKAEETVKVEEEGNISVLSEVSEEE